MNELIIERKRTILVNDQRVFSHIIGMLHDLGYKCYISRFAGESGGAYGEIWILNYRMDQIKYEWILDSARRKFENCQIFEGSRLSY